MQTIDLVSFPDAFSQIGKGSQVNGLYDSRSAAGMLAVAFQ